MTDTDGFAQALQPATVLAQSPRRFPGESTPYREARNALLAEEIELRRHIERVAAQRRALPPGGVVPQDYRFEGEHGAVTLSEMFGRHDTLVTYNWMFGPRSERSCPMCTSTLGGLEGEMADILQRVAFAVIARSPIERLVAFKKERQQLQSRLCGRRSGWRGHPGVQRLHPLGRRAAAFLGRRNGPADGRSRSGPARRTRHHAHLDGARHDAGRPRHELVSEARVRYVANGAG
jgi:hypothetical protein